ncbi:MAG: hypothetical protein FWD24_05420 [Treponema sp.]|nr:hypothetical protein [Treponema sp.]
MEHWDEKREKVKELHLDQWGTLDEVKIPSLLICANGISWKDRNNKIYSQRIPYG